MRKIGSVPICLMLALVPACSYAQETFKCRESSGSIVYSNVKCDKQGLKDAGPVRDRLTTLPATSPTGQPAAAKDARPPARKDDDAENKRPAPKIQAVNPLIEKLAK